MDKVLEKKIERSGRKLILSGILCGFMIGFFTIFSFFMANLTANDNLNKVLYGFTFPFVLFMIIINEYDLFTGNTMGLGMACKKRTGFKSVFKNLSTLYLANFIGCFLIMGLFVFLDIPKKLGLEEYLLALFNTKTSYSILKLIIFGILANFFVCNAVCLQTKGNTYFEKFLLLFLPIAIFAFLGFEHSIVNIFSLAFGVITNPASIGLYFYNLIFVTIGNILGGMLFYFSLSHRNKH